MWKKELMNSMFNCSMMREWSYEAFWFIFNHSATKHWATNVLTKVYWNYKKIKYLNIHIIFNKNCIKTKIYKLLAK